MIPREHSHTQKVQLALYEGRPLRFLVGPELAAGLLGYLPLARIRDATEMCRAAAFERAAHPDSFYWLGYCLYREGQFEQAEAAAVAALSRRPGYADAWWLRGWTCVRLNAIDEGIHHLHTAIGLKPRHAIAWSHLALALARVGHRNAAVRALRRALALRPHDASMRNCLMELLATDPSN